MRPEGCLPGAAAPRLRARGTTRRVALLATLLAAAPALADDAAWPSRALRLVSPFSPGGAIDVLNRVIAEKLAVRLGQPVVVDAIPGANTIRGAEVVAHAAPDGYTFMITTMSTHVNNTVLFRQLPYDPVKDYAPITQVSLGSVLLVARADAPYRDVNGFVAWARQQHRPISYGSWGIGSSGHVYGGMLARDEGLGLEHVPYKGEVAAISDVIGGRLDVTFASPVGARAMVAGGKLKALGMTGAQRSAAMPEVPTFAEQGHAGFELPIWVAAYAPAGTPRAIVDRLQREIAAVIRLPDVLPRLAEQGQTPLGNTPEEFAAAFARDAPRWTALIRASGPTPQ